MSGQRSAFRVQLVLGVLCAFAVQWPLSAAPWQRQQSQTAYPIPILLVSSTDHVTAVTGATVTVTLSKNGGGFGAASGAVTEVANGLYMLAGHATDRNTLGPLVIHATASGADPFDTAVEIVPYDPFARITANIDQWGGSAVGNMPLAGTSYTAPDNAGVAAIKAKTDNLPSDPASNTQVNTRLASGSYTAPDNAGVAAVKAKTDNLPADPASNTQVNTRLASASYTTPPTPAQNAAYLLQESTSGFEDGSVGHSLYVSRELAEFYSGYWRLTAHAVEQAPSGAGVDPEDLAVAVVDQSLTGHTTSGTVGGAINSAGAAADPLNATWPGSYGTNTFAYWIASMLDAPVTSRAGSDSAEIAVTSTVATTGLITLQAGDDYPAANPITLTRTWTDVNVSGYSAALWVRAGTRGAAGTTTGTVTHSLANGVLDVDIVLTHAQTSALIPAGESGGPFTYSYQVVLTSGDGSVVKSPFAGTLKVARSLTN